MDRVAVVQNNNSGNLSPHSGGILQRKCACGNRTIAVGECDRCQKGGSVEQRPYLLQPKLKIGQPDDKYEQEADRVAEQVMRMPNSSVSNSAAGALSPIGNSIQHMFTDNSEEQEDLVQTKSTVTNTPQVTPSINANIQSMQSGGQPLVKSERQFFEPRFGQNFSSVRIHTGGRAANTAKAIQARAFTYGSNVVFGAGEYQPKSESGRRLLAHELTHVVQQRRQSLKGVQRLPSLNALKDESNTRYSAGDNYGLELADTTSLFARFTADPIVPAPRFSNSGSRYNDYTERYRNADTTRDRPQYGFDCAAYSRSLTMTASGHTGVPTNLWGRAPSPSMTITRALMSPSTAPVPGQAYFIEPVTRSGRIAPVDVPVNAPWNNSQVVNKGGTNFHSATVVATDGGDVVTSEVNAAYPTQTVPWFNVYRGAPGFFNTFEVEYATVDGAGNRHSPRLYSYSAR